MGNATTDLPQTIRAHLAAHRGAYRLRICPAGSGAQPPGVPPAALARAELLRVEGASLLVAYPADRRLDLDRLSRLLRRRVEPSAPEAVKAHFPDCEPALLPPFGAPYGVRSVVDVALDGAEAIYFPAGVSRFLVRASREDFRRLTAGALRGAVTRPAPAASPADPLLRQRLEALKRVPPMPALAREIAGLRDNPYSNANELAAVVEQDPRLGAQLLHYARAPLHGDHAPPESVEQAVVQVLGGDFATDAAFGLALGKPFRPSCDGWSGAERFWRHAIYCAVLCHLLGARMAYKRRPSLGIAYLSGLLHNFGTLLLRQLFPSRFLELEGALRRAGQKAPLEVEREVMGLTHPQVGVWLAESWGLPEEVGTVLAHHHEPDLSGAHVEYVRLVQLSNRLLKRLGLGDVDRTDLPPSLLTALGLGEAQAEAALDALLAGRRELDLMARAMVA